MPPGVDLSAYRIIQESLTNVLKHAGAARATVRLDYGADELRLSVTRRRRRRDRRRTATATGWSASASGWRSSAARSRPARRPAAASRSAPGCRTRWRTHDDPVVLADDQPLVRAGLRMILDTEADLVVVGEATTGAEAVELCARERPDVVLMDVRMPVMDGIEATRLVTAVEDPPRVLVLTTFDLDEVVYDALRAGASGFLLKDAPEERLTTAIRVVADGGSLFAPSVTRRLIEEFAKRDHAPPVSLDGLTEREAEVLRLVARGLSNTEIAAELFITENTVKTHVARVLMKLGLRDRVQAVVLAYESGMVRPGGLRRLGAWTSSGTPSGRPALLNADALRRRRAAGPPRGPGVAGRPVHRPRLHAAAEVPARAAAGVRGLGAGEVADVIEGLNELMVRYPITPRISDHDPGDLHLHVADQGGLGRRPAGRRVAAGPGEPGLRPRRRRGSGLCAASPCTNVYVDTSPNASRRYCSDRCSSRANVAAYRARQRETRATAPRQCQADDLRKLARCTTAP